MNVPSVPTFPPDSNRTQTFTYDYLNRVSTAQSSATAGAACWGQSFTYDRYANLYQIGVTKCTAPSLSLLLPSATTNRFVDTGFAYDSAGNMTNDGPPLNTTYGYNAENQMKTEGSTTMTYDGDGLRVKKSNGKLSWRMPGDGPFIATSDASGGTVKDMIFFAGRLVAERTVTGGVVNYYFGDQLGSSRKLTDQIGTTCWDADYYPFGGANIFTTTCQPMYRFAQLESESDTSADMDYAMFRYYDHRFARFMSADPLGGNPGNPQTLNRYAYARNSPCSAVDPLGLADCFFNIAINNADLLSSQELLNAKTEINRLLGLANLGANFTNSSNSDFTLNLKNNPTDLMGSILWGVPWDKYGTNDSGGAPSNSASIWVNNVEMDAAGMDMGTALGRDMTHEFGHWALGIGPEWQRNPLATGIMAEDATGTFMNGAATFSAEQIPILRTKCKERRGGRAGGGGGGAGPGGIGGTSGGFVWISIPVWIETADQPILSWVTFGVFLGIPVQRE